MEYNSDREKLIMPEYGRNVQLLINHLLEIPDREERSRAAETVVKLMAQQSTQQTNQAEFMQKMWSHLFIMSGNKLDVDAPYPKPELEKEEEVKRERIPYPKKEFKYRFYGHTVELMIKKCSEMEEGEDRHQFMLTIAAFMRVSYKQWNDDKVSDEVILGHLYELSQGKLVLDKIPEYLKIQERTPIKNQPKDSKKFRSRNKKGKNYRSKTTKYRN
jgi:hypothetical protein